LTLDELKLKRNTRAEVIDFILADLDAAIPALPSAPPQPGRVTSGAALSLKARVLLYEYRFDESAAVSQQVINSQAYDLFKGAGNQSYIKLFSLANENNKEVIFDVQFSDQSGYG